MPEALPGHSTIALCPGGRATRGRRVVVEKSFGTDLTSAQNLNRILIGRFDESRIFRIDHYLGKRSVHNLQFFHFGNAFPKSFWNPDPIESLQISMAADFGVPRCGKFYNQTGTIRDMMQNHLFQLMANIAMDPPPRLDSESVRDEKVKILKAIPPLTAQNVVRGQFRNYRNEPGVAPIHWWRLLPRRRSRSIPGAGKAYPSISVLESACPSPAPRCSSRCAPGHRCMQAIGYSPIICACKLVLKRPSPSASTPWR